MRKADLLRLCEAHPDCEFSAFTNGTLIDEAFADKMLRVKNFIPAISVEGFEAATDARRGAGTFKRVERAMAILKQRRLPFGISCCYTSQNVEVIGSEAYFDQMIEWGAKFCWLFTYMPVGNNAVPELIVSPEQRRFMYEQVRKFRSTKPIFTMDFWNDGVWVYPLFGLHHPRKDDSGGAAVAAVQGLPRRTAVQRKPPAPLPAVGQPGGAQRDGARLGRALHRSRKPGERRIPDRQVRNAGQKLGARGGRAVGLLRPLRRLQRELLTRSKERHERFNRERALSLPRSFIGSRTD